MMRSPEVRLFQAYWDDGTLDLLAGGAVVLMGVGYMLELFLAEVIVLPLALAVWAVLRKWLVEPRAGYVEFSRRRRERTRHELLATVAVGAGVLVLFLALVVLVRGGTAVLGAYVDALPALLLALLAAVTGMLTRAWRFAVYAGVLAVAGAGTVVAGTGPGLALVVGGLIVWGVGMVLLVRFLAASRRFEASE
ncbi:MAG: hypothetical protein P8X58_00965 [Syntrophobacterales bacterium]|jgi:hypothetical protein